MCYLCADKCRTLPGGKLVEWPHLESARRQYLMLGKAVSPHIYSCVADDGSYVKANDPRAKHGPVAPPPKGQGKAAWDTPRDNWDDLVLRWPSFHGTAMGMGMHPSDPNRRTPASASGGAAAAASGGEQLPSRRLVQHQARRQATFTYGDDLTLEDDGVVVSLAITGVWL